MFNDSKQVLNDRFGSEKLFIIEQRRSYVDGQKTKKKRRRRRKHKGQ